MENYNEIQSTKNKIDLNNRKMTNHPPSPVECNVIKNVLEKSSYGQGLSSGQSATYVCEVKYQILH